MTMMMPFRKGTTTGANTLPDVPSLNAIEKNKQQATNVGDIY
jgi:hypothetical protein